MKMGRQRQHINLWLLAVVGLAMAGLVTAGASAGRVDAQAPPPTPTPDAEGVIYYDVQPNDSLWGITARFGLTFNGLLELNGLTEQSVIHPGDRLVVGFGPPPATPTVEPLPTATLPPPTPRPTLVPPRLAICLTAFEDVNRDGVFDAEEPLRPAVAFTIYDATAVVANYITDGLSEPHCVEGLNPGEYHITRSIAPQETLTNDGNWAILLAPGDIAHLEFGSYQATTGQAAPAPDAAPPTLAAQRPGPAATSAPAAPTGAGATTRFLAAALVIVSLLVAVISLVVWRLYRRGRII